MLFKIHSSKILYSWSTSSLSRSHVALSCALEKEPHYEDLQASHCDHNQTLQDAEVEDTLLRASYGREISVFSGAEVFLVSVDGRQLGGDFENGFFEDGGLLRSRALFGRKLCACFVLNLGHCQHVRSQVE